MIFSKRGVSPLIATILLVAVSLVIGAMVFSFSTQFTTKGIQQARESSQIQQVCGDAQFEVTCKKTNYTISLDFKNRGRIDLNGFSIAVSYTDGNIARASADTNLHDLARYDMNAWAINYTNSTPILKEVYIVPKTCPDIAVAKLECST